MNKRGVSSHVSRCRHSEGGIVSDILPHSQHRLTRTLMECGVVQLTDMRHVLRHVGEPG